MTNGLSTQEVVRLLDLAPHPEGGFYRQTFRDPRTIGGRRAASTAIYYLLPGGGGLPLASGRRRRSLALLRRRGAGA